MDHQGFAFDLLRKEIYGGNTLISPISVATGLATIGAGAKGETLDEIQKCLKLLQDESMHNFTTQLRNALLEVEVFATPDIATPDIAKYLRSRSEREIVPGPTVSLVNGLWVEKSLSVKDTYEKLIKGSYGTEVRKADFRHKAEIERAAINEFVSIQTMGKIKDLFPPKSLHEYSLLVLASTLQFKGTWLLPFDPQQTMNDDFYLLDGSTLSVPFMNMHKKLSVTDCETYTVLTAPYTWGNDISRRFCMFFILPNEKDGIRQLEKDFDPKTLAQVRSKSQEVSHVRLPKFRFSSVIGLKAALQSLGLSAAFHGTADFSDMVDGPQICYLDNIFQKCFIDVNEAGTDAAAASSTSVVFDSLSLKDIDFVADHPFLFVLIEEMTGFVMFIGRITHPTLSN